LPGPTLLLRAAWIEVCVHMRIAPMQLQVWALWLTFRGCRD